MISILKALGSGLLKAFGFKFVLKGVYRFMVRKYLVDLTEKLDPDNRTQLDEKTLKRIDEVFKNL